MGRLVLSRGARARQRLYHSTGRAEHFILVLEAISPETFIVQVRHTVIKQQKRIPVREHAVPVGRVRRHVDPFRPREALVDVAHASRVRAELVGGQMPVFVVRRAGPEGDAFLEGRPARLYICLLYTSPSPRDATLSRMPSSA